MEQIRTEVNFELEGIAPLLMDRFHGLPDPKTPEGYQKQAQEKAYRDSNGDLAIPASALKACMRYSSSELGKKTDGKRNRQTIASSVFFETDMLTLGKQQHDGIAQHVVTRGKGDKTTRVVSYRPLIKEWKVSGKMYLFASPPSSLSNVWSLAEFGSGFSVTVPNSGDLSLRNSRR